MDYLSGRLRWKQKQSCSSKAKVKVRTGRKVTYVYEFECIYTDVMQMALILTNWTPVAAIIQCSSATSLMLKSLSRLYFSLHWNGAQKMWLPYFCKFNLSFSSNSLPHLSHFFKRSMSFKVKGSYVISYRWNRCELSRVATVFPARNVKHLSPAFAAHSQNMNILFCLEI